MYESDSEEETSSSSAALPKRGRNGKAPLRAAPPALPVRAEESDLSDGGDADVLREDITMRELYQLLQAQSTQLRALQRQQDTGRSSSCAFLAEVEPSAQHSLSIKLSEADQQHYQNYEVKKQTLAHIKELRDLPGHLTEAYSLSRSALSAVQDISDRRVEALTVDIKLGVWVDKLGSQFKEVFDRIHANHGRSADSIQTAITEAVHCLRAQADLKKSRDPRPLSKKRNPRGGGRGGGGGGDGGGGSGGRGRGGGRGGGGGGGGGGGNPAAPNGP